MFSKKAQSSKHLCMFVSERGNRRLGQHNTPALLLTLAQTHKFIEGKVQLIEPRYMTVLVNYLFMVINTQDNRHTVVYSLSFWSVSAH